MKKKVRVGLYIVSVVIVIFIGMAIVRAEHMQKSASAENVDKTTEESTQESMQTEELSSEEQGTEEQTEDTQMQTVKETSIVFTGDVLFANSFSNNYNDGGIHKVVEEKLLQELTAADITMINEEFPFSTRGTQMADKEFTFRADPAYAAALTEMGADIVSLANNHILDFGQDALMDSCAALDKEGILYAGAGESVERAAQLQVIEVNGKKFGFLAASRVIPVESWNVQSSAPGVLATYDETLLVEKIEEADALCDVLTVYVHWGLEHHETPESYQRTLAQKYVTAGADMVIGSHPHALQGIEYIEGKPVFYSLGNFIFGSSIDRTMAVKVTVNEDNELTCRLIGAKASNGQTREMDALEQQQLNDYIQQISFGIMVKEDGTIH